MVYQFKPNTRLPVSPQVAGETLEAIREAHSSLTAKAVVEESRHKDAPLHDCFEWRDGLAAELYREEQARGLIRSVTVTFTEEPKLERPVRAFVHIQEERGEQSYVPIRYAMQNEALRAQVVNRALGELKLWKQRYKQYDELAKIFEALDEVSLF